jgi:hypothetical protein
VQSPENRREKNDDCTIIKRRFNINFTERRSTPVFTVLAHRLQNQSGKPGGFLSNG